jgi:predicted transcriptional regulator
VLKVSEYQQHADECRQMAAKMKDSTHKKQLEEMAEAWSMLARERRKQLARLEASQAGG